MNSFRDTDPFVVLRRSCALAKASAFDETAAKMLLEAARSWHVSGHADAQREACELVLGVLPEHFEALHLLGFHAQARGDFSGAELFYARALAARPDFAFSQLALSQLRMMRTHFKDGRDEYEARFTAVTKGSGADWRGLPIARWRGESLAEKKVYIWAEQGLGDVVMFAGFLPQLLAQSPARVALGMFPKLVTLFARSFPAIDVESADDAVNHALAPSALAALPQIEVLARHTQVPFPLEPLRDAYAYAERHHGLFDVALPMGDLLVNLMPQVIPARNGAYLKADPVLVEATRARLAGLGQGRRIGFSWHTTNSRETVRNVALEEWRTLLATAGCHFISLQHHADAKDIERFCAEHGVRIIVDTHVDPLKDAEGLAALIASMDAVVTIDNANAHLAGALGIPTALLLPKGHNFRWPELPDGGTLWYQTVKTLRQREAGDWRNVMEEAQVWLQP